ncbi:prepilin-type N-terminal cleavage/methylation domain-containing protein [Candidatus Falkowbacteria bacterium]|jgi:prepilin-type N-terminal cleavage/methylation domain-containing protein|nr:prepilin-type N-terminal cleavage/methylation domain-containing protein [Candidatus Falkowbacteria bacterium]
MLSSIKNNNGYNLLEVIIGVTILAVGITAILSISMKLIQAQDYVKHRETAILFSQEGFEAIKSRLEDNFNKCHVDLDSILNTWNCWGDVTISIDTCTCSQVFDITEGYKTDFDGIDWFITLEALNSWHLLRYNCVDSDPCYFSHTDLGSNSESTIFERKISMEDRQDYDTDGNDDMVKISSVVRWEERGSYKYVTTTSEFYNWRWRKE